MAGVGTGSLGQNIKDPEKKIANWYYTLTSLANSASVNNCQMIFVLFAVVALKWPSNLWLPNMTVVLTMIVVTYYKGELHNTLVWSGFKGCNQQDVNQCIQQNSAFIAIVLGSETHYNYILIINLTLLIHISISG